MRAADDSLPEPIELYESQNLKKPSINETHYAVLHSTENFQLPTWKSAMNTSSNWMLVLKCTITFS